MINVFLDDEIERVPGDGWVWVKSPQEAIELLATGIVERISLDNDLGLNGYDWPSEGRHVADWIEREAVAGRLKPLRVYIHTRNPAAARAMKDAIRTAKAAWAEDSRGGGGE